MFEELLSGDSAAADEEAGGGGPILTQYESMASSSTSSAVDSENRYSPFDMLAASLARLLRSQLSCVVAGHSDPDTVMKGIQCVRRLGGLVLAPDMPLRSSDRLLDLLREDPSPISRFDPLRFPALLGSG